MMIRTSSRRVSPNSAAAVVSVFLVLLSSTRLSPCFAEAAEAQQQLQWKERTGYPGDARHHPITFANETHAFLLTGSTALAGYTKDFYMYDEANDEWTDLSSSSSAFPGVARSFGYGAVLNQENSNKAYIGVGAGENNTRLSDWWEFDMNSHEWKQLADFPGPGRRHPAMNAVRNNNNKWEIHVGLGDGLTGNYNDWWSYDISTDTWTQQPDFPSTARHHPFYFGFSNGKSFAGLGHSAGDGPVIESDWYCFEGATWQREPDFASYNGTTLVTREARVAGTQFSIEMPRTDTGSATATGSDTTKQSFGFVLSGDGDDHGTMEEGEFHAFHEEEDGGGEWQVLPPHPGHSRWAPGSFVMRGTARAYFTSGYDRLSETLYNDLWCIDLAPLFAAPHNAGGDTSVGEDAPTPTTPSNPNNNLSSGATSLYHTSSISSRIAGISIACAWSLFLTIMS